MAKPNIFRRYDRSPFRWVAAHRAGTKPAKPKVRMGKKIITQPATGVRPPGWRSTDLPTSGAVDRTRTVVAALDRPAARAWVSNAGMAFGQPTQVGGPTPIVELERR